MNNILKYKIYITILKIIYNIIYFIYPANFVLFYYKHFLSLIISEGVETIYSILYLIFISSMFRNTILSNNKIDLGL